MLLMLSCCAVHAETESRSTVVRSDFHSGKSVCLNIVTAPFHARTRDLLLAGGAVSAVAIGSIWDSDIREKFPDFHGNTGNEFANVGHAYQSTTVFMGTTVGFYLTGLLANRPNLRRCGIELMEAHLLAAAGTQLMKFTVGRDRPYMENGPSHFVGPNVDNGHQSFFSGDVTVAFVQASVISAEAKSLPITVGLYGLAASTAFQRLYEDKHWFSDTVAAALWGTAVGLGVVHVNHQLPTSKIRLSLSPTSVQFSFPL
ncbi:MAG: phosphatase PAP2 family protein [bacterium]|nr:phosphatase PAP2 family protein [bacterium]